MTSARILPHMLRRATRGLWPVATYRDGDIVGFDWLATPIAQARLDASRAGTLDDYAVFLRPGKTPQALEMAVSA